MSDVPPVLEWIEKSPKLTKGLRGFFGKRKKNKPASFVTVRLGSRWGDVLKPGDRVAIGIKRTPAAKPKVIGHAEVLRTTKAFVHFLKKHSGELNRNIGAKDWSIALLHMQRIYGRQIADVDTLSVIELVPI